MKLQILKMEINSFYGTNDSVNNRIVDEYWKTKGKLRQVNSRREKIKRLYGG